MIQQQQQQPAAAARNASDAPFLDGQDYLSRHHSHQRHKPVAAAAAPAPAPAAPPAEVVDRLALVISGLTWWTTDAEVGALLSPSGPDSVSFVVDPLNGKSTGKVVVRFQTQSAADACKVGREDSALRRLPGAPPHAHHTQSQLTPPAPYP